MAFHLQTLMSPSLKICGFWKLAISHTYGGMVGDFNAWDECRGSILFVARKITHEVPCCGTISRSKNLSLDAMWVALLFRAVQTIGRNDASIFCSAQAI